MIVDLTTSENRRVVYSIQYWIINFAIMIGSGLSGWFFRDYLVWLLLAITIEEIVSCLVVIFGLMNPSIQILSSISKNQTLLKPISQLLKTVFSCIIYLLRSLLR